MTVTCIGYDQEPGLHGDLGRERRDDGEVVEAGRRLHCRSALALQGGASEQGDQQRRDHHAERDPGRERTRGEQRIERGRALHTAEAAGDDAAPSTTTATAIAVVNRLIGPRLSPRSVRYQCPSNSPSVIEPRNAAPASSWNSATGERLARRAGHRGQGGDRGDDAEDAGDACEHVAA